MDLEQRAFFSRRLMRRQRWVSLWLTRLLSMLEFFGGAPAGPLGLWLHKKAQRLARAIMVICVCQAGLRIQRNTARHHVALQPPPPHLKLRALIGGELRRAFKARTLPELLEKIRIAVEQPELLIARLCRRLRRGMSKLCAKHSRQRRIPANTHRAFGGGFGGGFAGLLGWAALCVLLGAADTS